MNKISKVFIALLIFATLYSCTQNQSRPFHFSVATDVHMYKANEQTTHWGFRDILLPEIKNNLDGAGKFLVITGDMDPFFRVKESVQEVMGNNYRFYPLIGNHDVGKSNNVWNKYPKINWANTFDIISYNMQNLQNIVNWGPSIESPALTFNYLDTVNNIEYTSTYDNDTVVGSEYTTYSFDEGNSHFVVLDLYSGKKDANTRQFGRITNELYDWLKSDLESTNKENIFVFGHQPIWHNPDTFEVANATFKKYVREQSLKQNSDNAEVWFNNEFTNKIKSREQFWELLKTNDVVAYFCGHTHKYHIENIDGIWEVNLDVGFEYNDKATFGQIFVDGKNVILKTFIYTNQPFDLKDTFVLRKE